MTKVVLRVDETVRQALGRLRRQMSAEFSRSWYKSRCGYYEKPSIRKRRKQRLGEVNRVADRQSTPLKMKMGLAWLYLRKRPRP